MQDSGIEVVICTHNPRRDFLERTLAGLKGQSMNRDSWRLLIIDNASKNSIANSYDLSWHPAVRVVREEALGLTSARLRAAQEIQARLLIFSDDDTVLVPNYLKDALLRFEQDSGLGVAGGPSIPEYEKVPAEWFDATLAPLGCRDFGNEEKRASWKEDELRTYPSCAPIGAGMVIRGAIFKQWAMLAATDPRRIQLGRIGAALSSGEDNDINMVALSEGWSVGYYPELKLTHLIAARRLEAAYLERLAFASSRDWISVLALHGICPWTAIPRWTVPFRKLRAWFLYRAWRGPAERIRWNGACGQFVGRSRIPANTL